MTGRDLLDAIGAVDEELLEHCQKTEQITAKNKMFWFYHGKKYVSIAACACLLIVFILGITYLQYNYFSVDDSLVKEDTPGITASLFAYHPERTKRLPGTGDGDGTDNAQEGNISKGTDVDLAVDTSKETDQDSKARNIDGFPYDDYQPDDGILPDMNTSSGTEGVDAAPKESESTDILASNDEIATKVDGTDIGPTNYSKGIKIESVKNIPEGNSQPEETDHLEDTVQPAEVISAQNILAQNTVIVRGTVKKIQHFHAIGRKIDVYFSVVTVKVKEVYRSDGKGNPQKGKTFKVYLPDFNGSGNSILGQLAKGSEVVIMPYIADAKTGIRKKGNFFAFLDVSDYYFDAVAAESHLFLKTKTGVLYDTRIYDIPYKGKKATLDDVGNYIKKMLKDKLN